MTDKDRVLIDATTRIFSDLCDPQTVNSAPDDTWVPELWQTLEESGLTLAWVSEEFGGAGARVADGFDILGVAGRFAVPVPLAETMLAGWLLERAKLQCPSGPMTVAPARPRDQLRLLANGELQGTAHGIPHANAVANLVAVAVDSDGNRQVVQVRQADCEVSAHPGLAGDGSDSVRFDGARPVTMGGWSDDASGLDLALMGAAARAVQIGGALQAILELATDYSKERVAFERPIAKFQAVQHNLARLAGETAAVLAASSSAVDTIASLDTSDDTAADAVFLEVASAKIRAGEAADAGAAIAHQTFGAIGFTAEHVLHRFTQRMWAWRDDFGTESEWALMLGKHVSAAGADALWPLLASR
jgi:acyl-CoA dehydrogenase